MPGSGSYDEEVMFDSATGNNAYKPLDDSSRNPQTSEKKGESSLSSQTEKLRNIIYTKVTKKKHHHGSPQKGDGTLNKCIEFFKQEASPKVLSELEKLLSERIELEESQEKKEKYQKHYKYYIENFLPALQAAIIDSKAPVELSVFNKEIEQSGKFTTKRAEILKVISVICNHNNKDHKNSEVPLLDNLQVLAAENTDTLEPDTSKLSSSSDSGVSSPRLSEENSESPVSSRRGSVSSTSSSAEKNSNSQEETGDQMQPVQIAEEEPQVQKSGNLDGQVNPGQVKRKSPQASPHVTGGEEPRIPVLATLMTDGYSNSSQSEEKKNRENTAVQKPSANKNNSVGTQNSQTGPGQVKRESPQVSPQRVTGGNVSKSPVPAALMTDGYSNSSQSEEKKDSATTIQKTPVSKDNGKGMPPEKQSNNRGLYKGITAGCIASAVGCLITGVMKLGTVGAGLFVMSVVLAIAAIVAYCLTPPSSELTSTNLSPLVDVKQR